jgi:hypothetical protein
MRKVLLITLAATLALPAIGCGSLIVVHRTSPAPTKVVVYKTPKPKVVVKSARPSAKHVWVSGNWQWQPRTNRYTWKRGRWVVRKAGTRWVSGRYEWKTIGHAKYKVWVRGHFTGPTTKVVVTKTAPRPKVVVVSNPAPRPKVVVVSNPAPRPKVVVSNPAPKVIVLPKAPKYKRSKKPGPKYVWVAGHYQWRGGKYRWQKGKWMVKKAGKRWKAGHYKVKVQGAVKVKIWVPGHWK